MTDDKMKMELEGGSEALGREVGDDPLSPSLSPPHIPSPRISVTVIW